MLQQSKYSLVLYC